MNGCSNLVKPDQGTDALLHERYILHRAGKIKFKNGNIKKKKEKTNVRGNYARKLGNLTKYL